MKFEIKTGLITLSLLLAATSWGAVVLGSGTSIFDDQDLDGVTFPSDNAPSVTNSDQSDTDADGIGDAIDPNPMSPDVPYPAGVISAPSMMTIFLGNDLVFSISAATGLLVPTLVQFDMSPTMSGAEAHEFVFTDLSSPQLIQIPASLFVDGSNWDLNTPGTYTLNISLAHVPGVSGSNTQTMIVNVVPEPSPGILALLGSIPLLCLHRRRTA